MPTLRINEPPVLPTRDVDVGNFPIYAKRTRTQTVAGLPQVTREYFRIEDRSRIRVIVVSLVERPVPQTPIPVTAAIERRPTNDTQIVRAFERTDVQASDEAEWLAAQAEAVTIFQALRI